MAKREKLEVVQSLLQKLLDESESGFVDDDFFSRLDDDEVEVLAELIDNFGWYIEYGGPLLVIIVPLIIWAIR